jgi:hypothetical protein
MPALVPLSALDNTALLLHVCCAVPSQAPGRAPPDLWHRLVKGLRQRLELLREGNEDQSVQQASVQSLADALLL